MSQPDFKTMPQQELRAYVIAHQDDQEAFCELVDRFHANPNKVTVKADEDMAPHIKRMVEREE